MWQPQANLACQTLKYDNYRKYEDRSVNRKVVNIGQLLL